MYLVTCALGFPLLADSHSSQTSLFNKDTEQPVVSSRLVCNGVYEGTVSDKPDLSSLRSNLGSVKLDAASFNYRLEVDTINPGITATVDFKLKPIDYAKSGHAFVRCVDLAGNVTSFTVSFTPRRLTLTDQSLGVVYPDSTVIQRVPFINNSGEAITATSIELSDGNPDFRLDSSTKQNQVIQNGDTLWVLVQFRATQVKDYSAHVTVRLGCDTNNTQSLMLRVNVGTLTFTIPDINFGEKEINTDWSVDVMAVNNGSLAATLQSLSLKNGTQNFSLKNVASLPLKVAAGASVKVAEVEFKPRAAGSFNDNFSYDLIEDKVGILSTPAVSGSAMVTTEVREDVDQFFEVQPNPAQSELIVQSRTAAEQAMTVQVFDAAGSVVGVYTKQGIDRLHIPVSAIPNGVYFCRVDCGIVQRVFRFMVVH